MKISARNQISGTIVSITPGAVNGSIKVDIGGGNVITANITEEAIRIITLPPVSSALSEHEGRVA